jgi:nitrate/nitrite transporter NarK
MAWFPVSELGLALGIRQTAIPIGGAVGAVLLPSLASAGGTRLPSSSSPAPALTGAASPRPSSAAARGPEPELGEVTSPVRDPHMWLLGAGRAST